MDKSRIFIASSSRTLVLAEKLRDELQTEFCEAMLWSEECRRQPGATIIEMLQNAAEQFDFAVVILAKDDVMVKDLGDRLEASGNCIFEAGLFTAAMGKNRCFLVNSVDQSDLPSDLSGLTSIRFEEPKDLNDSTACAEAIARVAMTLKDSMGLQGRSPYHVRVPTLSPSDLWLRERPRADGGDLRVGDVVVCDTQPMPDEELAVQVRRNMENGISYYYFLYFSPDTIEKVCQSLQVILVAGMGGTAQATDFNARASTIAKEKDRVLDDLRSICHERRLRITLLTDEPPFAFRVHNASNRSLARVYVRFEDRWFIPWAEGSRAQSVWQTLPKYVVDEGPDRLFIPLRIVDLDVEKKGLFERGLDRALGRYFPGIEADVKQICTGTRS